MAIAAGDGETAALITGMLIRAVGRTKAGLA